jgi:hypothetical protein
VALAAAALLRAPRPAALLRALLLGGGTASGAVTRAAMLLPVLGVLSAAHAAVTHSFLFLLLHDFVSAVWLLAALSVTLVQDWLLLRAGTLLAAGVMHLVCAMRDAAADDAGVSLSFLERDAAWRLRAVRVVSSPRATTALALRSCACAAGALARTGACAARIALGMAPHGYGLCVSWPLFAACALSRIVYYWASCSDADQDAHDAHVCSDIGLGVLVLLAHTWVKLQSKLLAAVAAAHAVYTLAAAFRGRVDGVTPLARRNAQWARHLLELLHDFPFWTWLLLAHAPSDEDDGTPLDGQQHALLWLWCAAVLFVVGMLCGADDTREAAAPWFERCVILIAALRLSSIARLLPAAATRGVLWGDECAGGAPWMGTSMMEEEALLRREMTSARFRAARRAAWRIARRCAGGVSGALAQLLRSAAAAAAGLAAAVQRCVARAWRLLCRPHPAPPPAAVAAMAGAAVRASPPMARQQPAEAPPLPPLPPLQPPDAATTSSAVVAVAPPLEERAAAGTATKARRPKRKPAAAGASQHAAPDAPSSLSPPPEAKDAGDATPSLATAHVSAAAPAGVASAEEEDAFRALPSSPPLPVPDEASAISEQAEAPCAEQPAAAAVVVLPLPPPQPQPQPPPPSAQRECCVCLESFSARELRVIVPCGHRIVCADCAAALTAGPAERRLCPECRGQVASVLRVYD